MNEPAAGGSPFTASGCFLRLFILLSLVLFWGGRLSAESLIVVDAGFVELEGYADSVEGGAVIRPEAELAELARRINSGADGIRKASSDFIDRLLAGAPGIERLDLEGGSLNRGAIDPERVLLWMTTVRHISRTFDDLQPRPELHFEFYLINPASQVIAFKQSVTVSLAETEIKKIDKVSIDQIGLALQRSLAAEKEVVARFHEALENYERRGASRMIYAVAADDIRFSERLEVSLSAAAKFSGRSEKQVLSDAGLIVASELNTIYSDEGLMLPILPPEAMAVLRQGEISGRSLWMRFNCDAVFLKDLPRGAFEYDRSSDLILISAELPVPDFMIGAKVDYFEDLTNARRSPVPPAFYPTGLMETQVEKRLKGTDRKLPLGGLSGRANPRYGGSEPPDVLLRGFSAALRSLYRSKLIAEQN